MSEKKPSSGVKGPAIRDLTPVLADAPPGEWVALSADRKKMVGHGKTMKEATEQARQVGELEPLLIKMPASDEGTAAVVR